MLSLSYISTILLRVLATFCPHPSPSPFPSLPLPFLFFLPFLRSIQLRGLGERCSSPSENEFCICETAGRHQPYHVVAAVTTAAAAGRRGGFIAPSRTCCHAHHRWQSVSIGDEAAATAACDEAEPGTECGVGTHGNYQSFAGGCSVSPQRRPDPDARPCQ